MIGLNLKLEGAEELTQLLDGLHTELTRELRTANQRIGLKLTADAKVILQNEVYNVPIPLTKGANRGTRNQKALGAKNKARTSTTKGKYGQWSRTGNLKRDESFSLLIAYNGAQGVVLTNNANYSAARAALGTPGSSRKAGVQRPQSKTPPAERSQTRVVDHWQKRAAELNIDWIRAEYAAALGRALRRG